MGLKFLEENRFHFWVWYRDSCLEQFVALIDRPCTIVLIGYIMRHNSYSPRRPFSSPVVAAVFLASSWRSGRCTSRTGKGLRRRILQRSITWERISSTEVSITYSLDLLDQSLVALIAYSLGFTYKVHEIQMQYIIDEFRSHIYSEQTKKLLKSFNRFLVW